MNARSNALPVLLLACLAASVACGGKRSSAELPPTWVWDQDQALVAPGHASRNAWNGWALEGGMLGSESREPRLVLWAREVAEPVLRVDYVLQGAPAELIVNNRIRRPVAFEPASAPRTVTFEAPVRAGMNFLEFRLEEKSRLRIARVSVGRGRPPAPRHLRAGESVTFFMNAGHGTIEWSGSGRLTERIREGAAGSLAERTRDQRSGFLSRRVRQEFALSRPGILTVTAGAGSFDIVRRDVRDAEKRPAPARHRRVAGNPPVIILLADACQAAHLSVYGYPRPTSPNLERFARDAVVFERAYANAAYTRSSVRSILSGQLPEKYGAGDLSAVADGSSPTLPEYLRAKGYRTSLFTSTVIVSPKFGFGRGFDEYFQYSGLPDKTRERKIDLGRFGAWLRGRAPVFSYVHFIEPHFPIVAPPPFRNMFAPPGAGPERDRRERPMARLEFPTNPKNRFTRTEVEEIVDDYDATIAYVDAEIGRALEEVKQAGLYDDALIIVLSDHGEALGEHGSWGHGRNVFEETARIVCLVKFPASMGLKGRVRTLVQGTDIFPTVMDLFGESGSLPGRSLVDAVNEQGADDGFAVSQSIAEAGQFAARWGRWYYIISLNTGREHLYDLERDALSEAGAGTEDVKLYMKARFLDWLKRTAQDAGPSKAVDLENLTPAEIEALKTLGYIH